MAQSSGNAAVLERPPPDQGQMPGPSTDTPFPDLHPMSQDNNSAGLRDNPEPTKESKSSNEGRSKPKTPEYVGYYLEKAGDQVGVDASWNRVTTRELLFTQSELESLTSETESAFAAFSALTPPQQGVVNRLVSQRQAAEHRSSRQWVLDYIEVTSSKTGWSRKKETKRILVILRRSRKGFPAGHVEKPENTPIPIPTLQKSDVIDLSVPLVERSAKSDNDKAVPQENFPAAEQPNSFAQPGVGASYVQPQPFGASYFQTQPFQYTTDPNLWYSNPAPTPAVPSYANMNPFTPQTPWPAPNDDPGYPAFVHGYRAGIRRRSRSGSDVSDNSSRGDRTERRSHDRGKSYDDDARRRSDYRRKDRRTDHDKWDRRRREEPSEEDSRRDGREWGHSRREDRNRDNPRWDEYRKGDHRKGGYGPDDYRKDVYEEAHNLRRGFYYGKDDQDDIGRRTDNRFGNPRTPSTVSLTLSDSTSETSAPPMRAQGVSANTRPEASHFPDRHGFDSQEARRLQERFDVREGFGSVESGYYSLPRRERPRDFNHMFRDDYPYDRNELAVPRRKEEDQKSRSGPAEDDGPKITMLSDTSQRTRTDSDKPQNASVESTLDIGSSQTIDRVGTPVHPSIAEYHGAIRDFAQEAPSKVTIQTSSSRTKLSTGVSAAGTKKAHRDTTRNSDQTNQTVPPDLSSPTARKAFMDCVVRHCLRNVGHDAAREWLDSGEAVEQVQRLLELFALMLGKNARTVPMSEALSTFSSRNAVKIAERLRDMASTSDGEPSSPVQAASSVSHGIPEPFGGVEQFADLDFASGVQDTANRELLAYLSQSLDFQWLCERMRRLATLSETGSQYTAVRSKLATAIYGLAVGEPLTLSLDWDPVAFMDRQILQGPRAIAQTVVYCGVSKAAYACTAAEYVRRVWPRAGSEAVSCVEDACSNAYRLSKRQCNGVDVELRLASGKTLVSLSWNGPTANEALELAEVYVWLATACRAHSKADCPAHCSMQLVSTTDPGTASALLQIELTAQDIDTERGSNGTCWLQMVDNPVVARGYPIPLRAEPEEQQGLEISLDLMVLLSHADWATVFGVTFLLKGLYSALLPMLEVGSSIVWHFMLAEGGKRMTYDDVCSRSATPHPLLLTADDLQCRRHFIGLWTAAVCIAAGTEDSRLYKDVGYSNSTILDHHTATLSNMSVSAGKFLTVGAGFAICKKDTSATFRTSDKHPFESHVAHASHMTVVFYGTMDRRAWLLDGASALMHLARLWLTCKGNGSEHKTSNVLQKLRYRDGQGDESAAVAALVENKNRHISIFKDAQRQEDESVTEEASLDAAGHRIPRYSQERSSSTQWKLENKSSTKAWTYQDLVLELWHILEAMHDKLRLLQARPPEFALKRPSRKPALAGWETNEVLASRGPFDPRQVKMKAGAGPWIDYTRETASIVLLARTFEDLIFPTSVTSECSRAVAMPKRKDLLAVPLYIFKWKAKRWMEDDDDCSKGWLQISDYSFWHSFEPIIPFCQSTPECNCRIASSIGKTPMLTSTRNKSRLASVNVFDKYPNGAAIIGNPNEATSLIASLTVPRQTDRSHQHGTSTIDSGVDMHSGSKQVSGETTENTSIRRSHMSQWNSSPSTLLAGISDIGASRDEWSRTLPSFEPEPDHDLSSPTSSMTKTEPAYHWSKRKDTDVSEHVGGHHQPSVSDEEYDSTLDSAMPLPGLKSPKEDSTLAQRRMSLRRSRASRGPDGLNQLYRIQSQGT